MTGRLQSFVAIGLLLFGGILIWRAAIAASLHATGLFARSEQLAFALPVAILSPLLVAAVRRIAGGDPIIDQRRSEILRAFAFGLLCFAIPFAIALAACLATGAVTLRTDAALATLALYAAAVVTFVFLAEALPEELLFRGAIQSRLRREMPAWPAIIAQALLFTVFAWLVDAASSPLDASFIFTFGVVLGILRATNSLPAPIGFHLAFMSTQQFMGPSWGLFEVGNPDLLRMVVCAIFPFSATIIYLFSRVR